MIRTMVVVLALCGAGLAQEGGGNKGGEGGKAAPKPAAAGLSFSQIDTNGDGIISKVEWLAYFAKLDLNKDGVISAEEAGGAAPAPANNGGEGGAKRKGGEGEGGKKTPKGEGK